tara:strand:+ start:1344 stop:2861 length:1518 start_codon:yes stop_codon:yes gene_type:complete
MENSIVKITSLYEMYKTSPNTISKLEYYINSQLPSLLHKYNEQEKRRLFLEKESDKYINNFLTDPNQQFFYIAATDTFIKYDGENYQFINEDDLWMIILNDITEKVVLIEWKQKVKGILIKRIKEQSLFKTIPESATVQYVINFFTPTLFDTKEDVKHFMALIGDNILNKKIDLHYFVPIESKLFFDTLESISQYNFKSKLGITSTIRYRYRGEDYNKSRLLYFTKSIQNKSCWLSFLKDNLYNFLVVCCYYSTRYMSADKYVIKRNESFKNKIFYLKNNTKQEFITKFKDTMLVEESGGQIHIKDMFFLWKMYLKQKNLPNMIYKAEFENILKDTINSSASFFINIKSNYLNNTKMVQQFWHQFITKEIDEELEISELHALIIKWSNDQNINCIGFNENNLSAIIEHFYDDVTIENGKFLIGIKCNLWDKQGDMLEAFQHKFNKEINKDITIYESYVMFCKYINNQGKLLTVSKKYYYKYIDKVIPEQYIKDGRILMNYWSFTV